MQAYFHYFRCKRVYLDSLHGGQWDKALLEEAYAAFTRARFKFYQDTGRKWKPYEDGIDVNRIPADSDNLIYIEWSGGDTGAIPSWYENTFEMGLYDEYVSPWEMDLKTSFRFLMPALKYGTRTCGLVAEPMPKLRRNTCQQNTFRKTRMNYTGSVIAASWNTQYIV